MANHLQEMRAGKEHLQSTLTGPLLHDLSHTNTQSVTVGSAVKYVHYPQQLVARSLVTFNRFSGCRRTPAVMTS